MGQQCIVLLLTQTHQKRFYCIQKEIKMGNFEGMPLHGALGIHFGVVFSQDLLKQNAKMELALTTFAV